VIKDEHLSRQLFEFERVLNKDP